MRGRRHAQFFEQGDQVRVGALVEHQKAGVYAVGDALALGGRQGDIHRVGVAAEIVARLKQGDVGVTAQDVAGRQAGDAGADDGDLQQRGAPVGPWGREKGCEAPRNEKGREGGGEEPSRDFSPAQGADPTSQP